jgi:hypothetical protein
MPTVSTVAAPTPDLVGRVLAAGQTTSIDPTTGRHQSLYADCPTDGEPSSVRRFARGSGGSIVEVTMRCPRCRADFVAPAESLYLW